MWQEGLLEWSEWLWIPLLKSCWFSTFNFFAYSAGLQTKESCLCAFSKLELEGGSGGRCRDRGWMLLPLPPPPAQQAAEVAS